MSLVSPGDQKLAAATLMTPDGGGGGGGTGPPGPPGPAGPAGPAGPSLITVGSTAVAGGTNGYALTINGGVVGAAPLGSGGGTTVSGTPPASPATGQLWWDNVGGQLYIWTGSQWVAASCCGGGGGGGSGTVTSVAATVPAGLAVAGSPITTSGTLAFTWSGTIPPAQIPLFSSSANGGVTASGGGTANFLRADGTWAAPPGGGAVSSVFGRTGTVVATAGDYSFSQISGQATLAQLPTIANNTVLGNNSGSAATPIALTQTQLTALIQNFTSTTAGDVPASGGGSTNFLRADGTWAVPAGTGGGTVNSVAMTVPSGLAVAGSPITSSGTLAVTWSGTIPATSLPNPSATTLGGTQSGTAPANNFMTGISTAGVPTFAQPAFSNLSGSATAAQMPAYTGDVTSPAGSTVNTIAAGAVTLAKMANLPANTVIGNNTGVSATPIALTQAQLTAMVQTFTSALSGAVPSPGGSNTTGFYLSGAGTWVAIPGGSTGANPTASVGLAAVNGVATTFMRSDAAPPLSQAIAPTWTGAHIFTSTGPQVTLGAAGGNAGNLALKGSTSGTVTVQPGAAAAGTYNFNLPTAAGSAGQVLTSQGGVAAAMTWTTPTTGTVTSVAMTVPAGLAVSGSPISGSGTFGVTWSGTIPSTSLPNPSASTLGGTQSGTAPANQFMTGISTAGVPTFAQPAFSNVSGQATLAQLPSIANNTVLGNVSGITAVPAALTQTQLTALINVFSSTLSGAVPSSSGQPANSLLGANGSWQGGSVQAGTPPSSPIDGQLWWDNVGGQLYVSYGGVWVSASCCGGGGGGATGANPTASVGLTAVNGSATTFMRSDAAPPLSQAIAPTWTGAHAFTSAGPQITLGAAGTNTGSLAYKGTTSGTITVQPQAAAGTYNWNLPTTAGSAGQVLTSQAGGSTAMTWTGIATSAQIWSNTSGLLLTTDQSWGAQVPVSLGTTGAITINLSNGINFSPSAALTGNVTLTFSNLKAGQCGVIALQAGSFTVSWGGSPIFPTAGAPAANTTSWTLYFYYCISSSIVAVNKVL